LPRKGESKPQKEERHKANELGAPTSLPANERCCNLAGRDAGAPGRSLAGSVQFRISDLKLVL
jgi:hypothetical protein